MAGIRDRFFVALRLPPEVRLAVDEWREGLALPGRPVPPEKFHVTLRFVGPAGRVGRERIVAALDGAELGGPFGFRVVGLGGFPRLRKAAVAWAALEGDGGRISQLAGVVDEAVASAGFGHEERPFRAHLTLARIRPPRDIRGSGEQWTRPDTGPGRRSGLLQEPHRGLIHRVPPVGVLPPPGWLRDSALAAGIRPSQPRNA